MSSEFDFCFEEPDRNCKFNYLLDTTAFNRLAEYGD